MNTENILTSAVLVGVVGWFIKGLITGIQAQIKTLEIEVAKNRENIAVLKSDHGNLEKKLDKIDESIREIFHFMRNNKND